jgi:putative ABC transport system permease protein
VISEIAVSVILLVGATLLMRSFSALERVDPGFDPRGVTGIAIEMPKEHFSTPVSRHAALVQVLDAVRRVPGVASAAVSSDMPPGRGVAFGDLMIDGRTLAASERLGLIGYASSGADYFRVTGIPLREGRIFVAPTPDASDSAAAQSRSGEIMVNQRFAKHYWPAGGAVGARIRIGDAGDWNTIVGVVGDVQRPGDLGAAAGFRIYAPFPATVSDAEILVRSSVASGALVARLTTAITHADPFIRVHQAQTAESLIADAVAQPRFAMILVGAFALLAVILAVVGLYGVMTYSVSQRTREIGVRIALGAHPREVIALVLRQGFILAAIGIVIGVAAAAGAARVIRSLLFGVSSGDPLTFVAASVLIASIAAVACYIPARRAALIDPVIALRTE